MSHIHSKLLQNLLPSHLKNESKAHLLLPPHAKSPYHYQKYIYLGEERESNHQVDNYPPNSYSLSLSSGKGPTWLLTNIIKATPKAAKSG